MDSRAGLQTFLSQQKPVVAITSEITQEIEITLALQPQTADAQLGPFLPSSLLPGACRRAQLVLLH